MPFKDHFSERAREYAAFRPRYPDALFEYLAELTDRHELAWDNATGNGQAAFGLARHFAAVVATDASDAQIAHATPHPGVEYRVAPGSESGIPGGSADLVTVAQGMHWLDPVSFFREARRVLRARGVVAVWAYGVCSVSPEVDVEIRHLYRDVLGRDWPPERRMVDEGYGTLVFPFEELPAPTMAMEHPMSLGELEGYIRTWSAVSRHEERVGRDPVTPFVRAIEGAWGDRERRRTVRWPLHLRVGRR